MSLVAAAFVFDMMEQAEPNAPWKSTYAATANAIANEANARPLYPGKDGPARTAAVMVGVAEMESHFDPQAKGDKVCIARSADGFCTKRGAPQSFCAFQIGKSNFSALGVTEEEILGDIVKCTHAALQMMHASFSLCSGDAWSEDQRLNQYATGGGVCVRPRRDEGEHRMRRAKWLYRWKLAKDKRIASNAP